MRQRSRRVLRAALDRAQDNLTHVRARTVVLSPAATMQRGYAVLQTATGTVVRAADEVSDGDVLRARLADGEVRVVVGP